MKWRSLIVCASLALAVTGRAEDKVSADIEGTVDVQGINFNGVIDGDAFPSYAQHAVTGKVSVVTKDGGVHRIETFTEWGAENGVRGQVWEKLFVSGRAYTGWSERLIQTPANIVFSRTVINGTIDQKIRPDGSGYAEWTVAGSDNGVDNGTDDSSDSSSSTDTAGDTTTDGSGDTTTDSSASTSGDDLPTVEIMEEGEFDGVSARRIEIDPHGDHPTLTFTDDGYTRATVKFLGADRELTVDQRLRLDGKGKGSVAYLPSDKPESSASPTPTPTPAPTATPIPTPTPTDGTTDGTTDDFGDNTGTDFGDTGD